MRHWRRKKKRGRNAKRESRPKGKVMKKKRREKELCGKNAWGGETLGKKKEIIRFSRTALQSKTQRILLERKT